MSTGQVTQLDDMSAKIVAMMPIIRREAFSFIKKLPASVELDKLIQQGRLAAWEAITKFDGRGNLNAYAVTIIRQRFIDFQRTHHPAGRNGNNIVFESLGDDEREDVSDHADPTADAVIDKLTYEEAMASMEPRRRAVVERVLAGEPKEAIASSLGVSASRVSQLLDDAVHGKKRNRTPEAFDPDAPVLIRNAPIPPILRPQSNKFIRLMNRMHAGDAFDLDKVQANSLVSQLKRSGVRHLRRELPNGRVRVVREPSAEQMRSGTKYIGPGHGLAGR